MRAGTCPGGDVGREEEVGEGPAGPDPEAAALSWANYPLCGGERRRSRRKTGCQGSGGRFMVILKSEYLPLAKTLSSESLQKRNTFLLRGKKANVHSLAS